MSGGGNMKVVITHDDVFKLIRSNYKGEVKSPCFYFRPKNLVDVFKTSRYRINKVVKHMKNNGWIVHDTRWWL